MKKDPHVPIVGNLLNFSNIWRTHLSRIVLKEEERLYPVGILVI